jgi:predicted KAP-like P-loop ATPase
MDAILAILKDPEAFAERLERLSNQRLTDGSTRVHIFLERLRDYTDGNINSYEVKQLINLLLDIGDNLILPEDEFHSTKHKSFYDLSNDSLMRFRIMDLLKKLKNEERLETLRNAFINGRAITMPVEVVRQIGKEYGKYDSTGVAPDGLHTMSKEDLGILEGILLKKIKVAAENQCLIKSPHLPLVLHSWQQLGEEEKEIQEWVKRIVSTDDGLIKVLESFLTKSATNLGMSYSFEPSYLKPYIEPFDLIDRVKEIAKKFDSLTEMQRTAIAEFINGCENWKQAEIANEGDTQ